ncbi:aminotransferase class III-fold pyridoxal phosphate-dependent enzyme [Bacillus mexicanus]|uniref:aspartate aminotransferase family protein n=1 Tax=Bacillus mexicanus TaxID=2834415 RepID=UPI003D229FC6
MSWLKKDVEYLLPAYHRLPLAITKGQGCYLYDDKDNAYLDMFSGVGVNQLGYNHPILINTIKEQSVQIIHSPLHFFTPSAIEYAEKLSELSTKGKVFFTTSGTEATEAALKMLFKFKIRTNDERRKIIVLKNSFHGRTFGSLTFTRQESVYQDYPSNNLFDAIECSPNNIREFENLLRKEKPLAFMMEPVLGSGGIIPIEDSFIKRAKQLCEETNTIFVVDEIQTGMGRTGLLFSYQSAKVKPDIILFGKGAGGGIPLGGVIANKKISDTYNPGDHGTTWANPPLATALGLTLLRVLIRNDFLNVKDKSSILLDGLNIIKNKFPQIIKEIRYKGLMFGITLSFTKKEAKEFQLKLLKNGVLVDIIQGNIIRLLPPLIITEKEIYHFLTILDETIINHQLNLTQRAAEVY